MTISGLTNTYSSYTVTYEEYQAQRYEAASTIFGPHTLDAYIQEFSRLAKDLVAGRPSVTGPAPPDLSDKQIQLIGEPKFDRVPDGKKFGDVLVDTKESYGVGEPVVVKFQVREKVLAFFANTIMVFCLCVSLLGCESSQQPAH